MWKLVRLKHTEICLNQPLWQSLKSFSGRMGPHWTIQPHEPFMFMTSFSVLNTGYTDIQEGIGGVCVFVVHHSKVIYIWFILPLFGLLCRPLSPSRAHSQGVTQWPHGYSPLSSLSWPNRAGCVTKPSVPPSCLCALDAMECREDDGHMKEIKLSHQTLAVTKRPQRRGWGLDGALLPLAFVWGKKRPDCLPSGVCCAEASDWNVSVSRFKMYDPLLYIRCLIIRTCLPSAGRDESVWVAPGPGTLFCMRRQKGGRWGAQRWLNRISPRVSASRSYQVTSCFGAVLFWWSTFCVASTYTHSYKDLSFLHSLRQLKRPAHLQLSMKRFYGCTWSDRVC